MLNVIRVFVLCAFATVACQVSAQEVWREGEFRGVVILTVTGDIGLPTRAGSTEEMDKFFHFHDVEFEKAAQFDVAALLALPQTTIRADFPKDGPEYTFEGPLLQDVLEAVAANGQTVSISALDGYTAEIPLEEAYAAGAVVALKRDGIPFAIGDFGPTHLVFPRAERSDLADMNDDWWVWSVYHIHVE